MSNSRKRLRLGIRQKVLLVLMTVLLCALTATGWFALQKEKEDAIKEINQRGMDITRFVAKSLAYSVVGYDYHTIQLLLDEIIRSDEINSAKVTNAKGRVMSQAGNTDKNKNVIIFNQDIVLDEDIVGHLEIGINSENTTRRLESQKYFLVTREATIILMIALAEFIALSFIIINPVKIISRSLDNGVDVNGKIIAEIPLDSEDEFGQLAKKFNQLGKQLNEANYRLQAKIDLSDTRLRETNEELKKQSEELKRMNEEFRLMSITDALTGLYNRRHFEELIKVEVDLSKRHKDKNSLMIIDIDHFKAINDTHGHFIGDTVLKNVAMKLKEQLHKTDVLCRVGGEEFAVLCKRAGKDEALLVAEKLKFAINSSSISIGSQSVNVSVSFGIATIPDLNNTETVDEFYKHADTALYFSKEHGRNRYTHYDDLPDSQDFEKS